MGYLATETRGSHDLSLSIFGMEHVSTFIFKFHRTEYYIFYPEYLSYLITHCVVYTQKSQLKITPLLIYYGVFFTPCTLCCSWLRDSLLISLIQHNFEKSNMVSWVEFASTITLSNRLNRFQSLSTLATAADKISSPCLRIGPSSPSSGGLVDDTRSGDPSVRSLFLLCFCFPIDIDKVVATMACWN